MTLSYQLPPSRYWGGTACPRCSGLMCTVAVMRFVVVPAGGPKLAPQKISGETCATRTGSPAQELARRHRWPCAARASSSTSCTACEALPDFGRPLPSLSLSLSLSIALDPSVPLRPPPHQIATGHARRTLESRHQNIHMDQSIITPQLQAIEKQTSNEQSTKTYRHIDNVKQTNRQTDKRNRLHLFFSLSLPFVVPAFRLQYPKKTLQCNNLCEHNNLPHNV